MHEQGTPLGLLCKAGGGALCSEVGSYQGQVEVSKGGRRQLELGGKWACGERQG